MQEGLALFLVNSQDKKEEVYFEDKLPDKYKKYSNIAGPILSLRNIVIILAFIEIGSAVWGFSYFFIRRVKNFFVNFSLGFILLLTSLLCYFRFSVFYQQYG